MGGWGATLRKCVLAPFQKDFGLPQLLEQLVNLHGGRQLDPRTGITFKELALLTADPSLLNPPQPSKQHRKVGSECAKKELAGDI